MTTKEELLKKIESFSPDELELLGQILDKKQKTPEEGVDTEENDGKIKRRRRRKKVLRQNPNKKGIRRIEKGKKKNKGKAPKVMSFDPNRKRRDLFVERGFDRLHKEESEIDKKLWANRKPSPRIRPSSMVEIDCDKCGESYEVSESLVYRDADGNYVYVCDNCVGR